MTTNVIGVSTRIYADIEERILRSKDRRIQYTFDGDSFPTRIVRREGELIGYDPAHPEGRPIVDCEQMMAAAATSSASQTAGTFKGWMMTELMRRGFDMDTALQRINAALPPMVLGLPPPQPGTPQAAAATTFVETVLAGVGVGSAAPTG
jgi:hypothetical protein